MRFIYYFILGLNFFSSSLFSGNNALYMGINKCEIPREDFNPFILEKLSNNSSKISITSKVKIRNNRINLAISEAKLKAKKKLIKFLKMENFDNKRFLNFSNNSFNYDLRGAIVTEICIDDDKFLKLYLELNDKNINTNIKHNKFINKD